MVTAQRLEEHRVSIQRDLEGNNPAQPPIPRLQHLMASVDAAAAARSWWSGDPRHDAADQRHPVQGGSQMRMETAAKPAPKPNLRRTFDSSLLSSHHHESLYLNGEYPSARASRVSVEDRGFQFGDGVYEVIRVYRGKPFRLAKHLARLEQSVKGIEIPLPEPLQKIEEVCRTVVKDLQEAQIYLQVTRGAAPRVHAFPQEIRPTFVAYAKAVQPHPADRVFTLKTVTDDRWGRCHLKTICLLPNILGKQRAVEAKCDEGLFVRENGIVTEGTTSNAFFVRGGALFTHPADNRILNGDDPRGGPRESPASRASACATRPDPREAMGAEEAFVTGTLTEIMPGGCRSTARPWVREARPGDPEACAAAYRS
jgi:D-alanine transaminase